VSIDPKIIKLYDEYTHAPLDRRVFLDRLAKLTGGAAAAAALLPLLESNYALAQMVPENDAGIVAETLAVAGPAGPIQGYLVRPAGVTERRGAVMVIHENRGLNPHIRDVTRRVAKAGFVAYGVDFLSRLGGTPADEDKAREMFGQLRPDDVQADAAAVLAALKSHPASNGKVGAVGFCWGGGTVATLSTRTADLAGGVVFYGVAPAPATAAQVRSPLLIHLASLDERVNNSMAPWVEALKTSGKRHTLHMYEGVNHAFHNDTGGARYSAEAAKLAWDRTIAFFRETLA
jgi:carboxymethylenebutenolidase